MNPGGVHGRKHQGHRPVIHDVPHNPTLGHAPSDSPWPGTGPNPSPPEGDARMLIASTSDLPLGPLTPLPVAFLGPGAAYGHQSPHVNE